MRDVKQTIAVGLLVEVAHELAPAEELADEALGAGEWDEIFAGGAFYIADELDGEVPGEVDEGGGPGVKELRVIVAHGVFKGAEGGKKVIEREAPHAVAVGLGAGHVKALDGAEVVSVLLPDVGDDLGGDCIGREGWRRRDRDLAFVRVAVVGVEGELAANRLRVLHKDAGLLAHGSVEAIHHVALSVGVTFFFPVGAVDGGEVFRL